MITMKTTGVKRTIKQLNREVRRIKRRTLEGMVEGAQIIRADAQRKCPVDTGNLKNSAFVVWPNGKSGAGANFEGSQSGKMKAQHSKAQAEAKKEIGDDNVMIGFSAYYAVYVHENSQNVTFQNGEEKFLEKSIRRNQRKVLNRIKRRAEG